MNKITVSNGPDDCTRQELAMIAFHEAGIYDDKAFSLYWMRYQELLAQKLGYENNYLADMLKEQSEQRAAEARNKRKQNLIFALLFSLSFILGRFSALFFFGL